MKENNLNSYIFEQLGNWIGNAYEIAIQKKVTFFFSYEMSFFVVVIGTWCFGRVLRSALLLASLCS